MAGSKRRARALLGGISVLGLMAVWGSAAVAQNAQTLDPITVLATKTEEKAIDSLAAVSTVRQEQLDQLMPSKPSEALLGIPGVWFQERNDDPGTAINIRGLQDFGRVNVLIDGARQNFQRTGHNADGIFYLEPELLSSADVVRGPVANIFGSGAIGGVVSFRTKDVDDVLKAGERWGVLSRGEIGSNGLQGVGSTFVAARGTNADIFFGGTYRSKSDYSDAHGNVVPNTGSDVWTGIAKVTFTPMDGHTVKFGFINYDADYKTGQPFPAGTPPPLASIYATHVTNQIANARWIYSRPDDNVFNFDGNAYWTRTVTDQTKTAGTPDAATGLIGDSRNFAINTIGIDLNNTSRFETGAFRHAVTVGVDAFTDQVDTNGFGTVFTPSGERTVSGAFLQWKTNYMNWLEVIGALRYDHYSLDGGGFSSEGERVSPKITVGITPFQGFTPYVTYAEGYRAPAVTETLVSGLHPVNPTFTLLPNPGLMPEIGKTKEAGINLKYDNIFTAGDAFRAKVNVYQNDVENFINLQLIGFMSSGQGGQICLNSSAFFCEQYQNIPNARLRGFEFESTYDAGLWFAGLAGSHVEGRDLTNHVPLARIPTDQITTTLGARFLDQKLTVAVRWQAVSSKDPGDIPVGPEGPGSLAFYPTSSYNLVNLYVGYLINPDTLASLSVENLLNEQYSPYLNVSPSPFHGPASTPLPIYNPGITVKGALKIRFADGTAGKG